MRRPRRWSYRASTILLAVFVLMVVAADAASAAGCLDEARSLAERYQLSSDPPTVPTDQAPATVQPADLARSGGVIEPPPSPDRAVITPPRSAHDAMPTVPDVKDGPQNRAPVDAGKLGAAEATTLQSLLVAARAQAERGAEAECRDRLREARELIERAKK